jgi:hypothetical protein
MSCNFAFFQRAPGPGLVPANPSLILRSWLDRPAPLISAPGAVLFLVGSRTAMRVATLICAIVLATGCQVQNPLAAFSPRIASPTTSQAPYYPPSATAPQPARAAVSASPRLSVSAETNAAPPPSSRTLIADATDREPIRVVENPAGARTASSGNRTSAPAGNQAPRTLPPINAIPRQPGSAPQSRNIVSDAVVMPAAYQQNIPAFTESAPASGQWRAR